MPQFTYTPQTEEVLAIARKKTVELNLENLPSEVLLFAIIEHGNNDGLEIIKKNGANVNKLSRLISDRMKQIKMDSPFEISLPKMTKAMKDILVFAHVISVSKPISPESLVHSLFQTADSYASQMLVECEYREPGSPKRRVTSSRTANTNTPALNAFAADLTVQAQEGKLDPVIGRQAEIERLIEILARRKKNNPALIGEPGVGKTAIVEGLSQRISDGNVPPILRNRRVLALDLNSVVAGTQYRGQFEERMQRIIKELKSNPDIIIFIDEMHTLMGAGGTEGTGDAGNIIKPALASGQIRCIGATTLTEYRRHIEKNGALDRRFQKVTVEQPTLKETTVILQQIVPIYALFHGIGYGNVIPTIVDLAERYISDRFFPDKAIDILDESGALTKLAPVVGTVQPVVTEDAVRHVVSKISGVPVTDLNKSERERLKRIDIDLKMRVVGQDDAVDAVSNSIKRRRTGVSGVKRPSSFLFIGPTGVGKTELARQLANYLFSSVNSMIRLDMAEFFDRFTISSLIGAPPGYIGYDEGGGKLTEKVRKKPYSVVLLDELEKAHSDVLDILLSIMDDGVLTDAQGRVISFKNAILIMTSNVGSANAKKKVIGFNSGDEEEQAKSKLKESLKNHFKVEFLNRIDEIVTFGHLTHENMAKILDLQIQDINPAFEINILSEAREWFLKNGYSEEFGARPMRRLLEKHVETGIAEILLDKPEAKKFEAQMKDDKIQIVEVN